MAASTALRTAAASSLKDALHGCKSGKEIVSVAQKLTQSLERELLAAEELAMARLKTRLDKSNKELRKSFPLHLGAVINLPTSEPNLKERTAPSSNEASRMQNPFAGLPLQAWAERLGERVMPAYELVKEEQQRAKAATKPNVSADAASYSVPHLLPFTRWAANNKSMRETFIAADPKTRKRARLSWYHPDDTMVPRDWFKGGLLEDLKYYSPFRTSS